MMHRRILLKPIMMPECIVVNGANPAMGATDCLAMGNNFVFL